MKYFKIYLLLVLVLGFSCVTTKNAMSPTNNLGGYIKTNVVKKLNQNSNEVVVFGKIVNVKTKKPLVNSRVYIGCVKVETNELGQYKFKFNKSIKKQTVSVSSIGYKKVETLFFDFDVDNLYKIDFFLEEDNRPLLDCN